MVILASASPQRKALLEQIGIEPIVVVTELDEKLDNTDILSSLENLAKDKAAAALAKLHGVRMSGMEGETAAVTAATHSDRWIIGADTVILFNGTVLGKPQDAVDARKMLEALSGKTHRVATGVYLGWLGPTGPSNAQKGRFTVLAQQSDVSITSVTFRSLSEKEIGWYIESGEWHNAAGAYRIQSKGACLVTSISGSFSNVVGLPLELIYGILIKLGYKF